MRRLLPLATLLFTAACGGGNGDAHAQPTANELGDGNRIHDIVGAAGWLNPSDTMSAHCSPPADSNVYVTGVTVIAIDKFDETNNGSASGNFYVEDTDPTAGDYAGITVFGASFTPPDLRLAENDVVDILGQYTEFLGPSAGKFGGCDTLPEFTGTISFRFDGNNPPAPRKVPVDDLTSYEGGRKHLGQLIELDNVVIAGDGANKSGRYTAPITTMGGDTLVISNELYDLEANPGLKMGDTFKSVTGVLTYFYGFHVAPRSSADLAK